MNPSSEDIKDILESVGALSLTFATNLFIGEVPSEPDECVAIFDSPGFDEEPAFIYERPAVQIRVRGEKGQYRNAFLLAQSVKNALRDRFNETWNSTRYIGIWMQGSIIPLGHDKNHRPEFSMNFNIHRSD